MLACLAVNGICFGKQLIKHQSAIIEDDHSFLLKIRFAAKPVFGLRLLSTEFAALRDRDLGHSEFRPTLVPDFARRNHAVGMNSKMFWPRIPLSPNEGLRAWSAPSHWVLVPWMSLG